MASKRSTQLIKDLTAQGEPAKVAVYARFFKTGPGQYGAGDKFLGVAVPKSRAITKQYKDLSPQDIEVLLKNPYHEVRLTGLLIIVLQYQTATNAAAKNKIISLYRRSLKYVNNWDFVDTSAPYLFGPHYFNKSHQPLIAMAASNNMWHQRIAILSTFYFIKQGHFKTTLKIAKILLHHDHDLIHKAVGWMLREVGNRDRRVEETFLKQHYKSMPRTMLRYAIEKFPEKTRQAYLKGKV